MSPKTHDQCMAKRPRDRQSTTRPSLITART
jgi:hypothetical protein